MSNLGENFNDSNQELDLIDTWLPFIPTQRIEKPVKTVFQPGDIVEILVSEHRGLFGQIVIERNGNYIDKLYTMMESKDEIGLVLLDPPYNGIDRDLAISEVLWFTSADQLDLVFPTPDQPDFLKNRLIPSESDKDITHWSL